MRSDPDHTTDGPDIDGLFDALDGPLTPCAHR